MKRRTRTSFGICLVALVLAARGAPACAAIYGNAPVPVSAGSQEIHDCLVAAASAHHLSPLLLVILLNVEGGRPGKVSQNSNDTVDIGPMQINQIWLPKLAGRWHASTQATFLALRDNVCANLDGGAWILRSALDETPNFWDGVSLYHSHTPEHQAEYLRQVLRRAMALERTAAAARPPS